MIVYKTLKEMVAKNFITKKQADDIKKEFNEDGSKAMRCSNCGCARFMAEKRTTLIGYINEDGDFEEIDEDFDSTIIKDSFECVYCLTIHDNFPEN